MSKVLGQNGVVSRRTIADGGNLAPFKPGQKPSPASKRPLNQAIRIQDVLFAEITKKKAAKGRFASLARAWCDVEERRRILMGKPLPGVLKPEAKPRKQRQSSTPSPIRRPQVVAFEQPQTPQDNSACGV